MQLTYRTPDGAVQMTLARALMQHRTPIAANPDAETLRELAPDADEAMQHILADAEWAFEQVKDKPIWAATLSGGKDSAATVCLAIEYLKRHPDVRPKLVILHADTLMESPPMEEFARFLMDAMQGECKRNGIDCEVWIVTPTPADDFWTLTLGYGYPPFSSKFRPCTERIKIVPQTTALKTVAERFTPEGGQIGDVVALLLGVRTDESDARREGLSKVCNLTDGECGQILDAPQHLPGVTTVAPIINARTCKVWDLDMFILPALGWPVERLAEIYGDDVVRFGCWMCPLVKRVRDVENLLQLPENAWMEHLLRFREDFLSEARNPANRMKTSTAPQVPRVQAKIASLESTVAQLKAENRDATDTEKQLARARKREEYLLTHDSTQTGTTLAYRVRQLASLLALQGTVGRQLIRPEVVEYIHLLWADEKATGRRGRSGKAKGA